jgi:Flp pilus assembly pilin Flp
VAMQPSRLKRKTNHSAWARLRDERGQTMAEYAVILTLITTAVVATVAVLSGVIGVHITDIANLLP